MSITATDLTVYEVQCSRCRRPDTLYGYSVDEVRRRLEAEGWVDETCLTCQAEEGLTPQQIAADYLPNPVDDLEGRRPSYLMGGGL